MSAATVAAPTVLDAALSVAAMGWPCFPCRPGSKVPATVHGCLDATLDPDLLRWWWARTPDANLAVATGWPGPDVLDVDVKPGESGFPAMQRLHQGGLLAGALGIVATPRGGLHLYYAGSEQGNRTKIGGQPLDYRGRGGYVLAPPSVVGGVGYRVQQWRGVGGRLDLPAVERMLTPARRVRRGRRAGGGCELGGLARWVAGLEQGNRNAGLYWAACRTIERDGDERHLDVLADAALVAGLPLPEVTRTIESARRRVEVPR